ncbi:hypothetical protein BsWGS_10500 [Bradybaena similaris]
MYTNFQSQSELDARKDEIRKQRKLVIEQAKKSYEYAEAKKEKARQEGQDTWMLDSVSHRIKEEEKQMHKSKKDKKKRKKEKKDKKKKKKKKHSSSSSSSDSDGDKSDEEQWVETKAKAETVSSSVIRGPQLQRESWMESPLDIIPTTSKQELRDAIKKAKGDAKKETEKMLEPGRNAKELNPYWKDGGTGLPEENPDKLKRVSLSATAAGDAGLSWLRKAYDRCKQQALDEGRSLEEVAAERWGSLKKLESMIKEAEKHQKGARRGESWRDERNNDRRREDNYRQNDGMLNESKNIRDGREKEINRRRERSKDRDDERNRGRTGYKGSNNKDEDASTSRKADRQQRMGFQRPCSGSDSEASPPRSFVRAPKDDTNEKQPSHFHSNRQQYHSSESRTRYAQSEGKQQEKGRSPNNNLPRWKKKTEFEASQCVEKDNGKKKTEDGESLVSKSRNNHKLASSSSSGSSSSGSDSESDESANNEKQSEAADTAPARVLSEEELNELAAKILRAEIMGDDETAASLKLQLENARKVREASKAESGASVPDFAPRRRDEGGKRGGGGRKRKEEEEDNVVVLSRTSKSGLVQPVLVASDDIKTAGGKRRKNVATHDSKGERTIYFDNDDKLDLKTMVEQEKAGTAEDQNSMFARLAGRSNDRDLDVDDMFVSKAARKQNEEQAAARDRSAAIFEHKKISAAMEKCHRCFGKVSKHLIIAIGTKSYLCLPHHRSLAEGHCFIVPMQHVSAATSMDEDVWQEIQLFRKSLVQMFAAQGEDVVIMETVKNLKHFPHTAIECVPLDKELGDLAPIYFKKAVQEAGPEWSDNKKLHSLSGKDVRRVIPKGFPYFSVDFGLQGGYATVIEDESKFPAYFGREIVGGMLDAEPTLWRKPHNESFEDQRKKVLQFAEWWKPYDWTQTLVAVE